MRLYLTRRGCIVVVHASSMSIIWKEIASAGAAHGRLLLSLLPYISRSR